MFFKKIAKTKGLSPEAAIYSISEQGDAFYYDIIEPSTLEKIFGTRIRNGKKNEIMHINTITFRDNFGYPYKVNNFEELVKEMERNKNPISCLYSEYDEIDERFF